MRLVLQLAESGRTYEFTAGKIRIGRHPSNDISLPEHSSVSRHHAEIELGQGQWRIVDLQSTNGVFINRRRVDDAVLRHGDELQLGADGPSLRIDLDGFSTSTQTQGPVAAGAPSEVDLFPLHMGLEPIKGKGFLLPGLVAGMTGLAVLTASTQGNIKLALTITQLFFSVISVAVVYRYCGKVKPLWVFIGCGFIVGLLLAAVHNELIKPLEGLAQSLGGKPGRLADGSIGFGPLQTFVRMLFLAAIPEELEKIAPAAIGLALFMRSRARRSVSALENDLFVKEPLDGILMAVAAAAGFTVLEGVVNPIGSMTASLNRVQQVLAAKQAAIPLGSALELGMQVGFRGFAEALFRAIGNICGHQAYSGIFGYYVGLAAMFPDLRKKLILRGFLTAVLMHTLWNTLPALGQSGAIGGIVVTLGQGILIFCSLALLIACILQARKLSPNRSSNFATQLG